MTFFWDTLYKKWAFCSTVTVSVKSSPSGGVSRRIRRTSSPVCLTHAACSSVKVWLALHTTNFNATPAVVARSQRKLNNFIHYKNPTTHIHAVIQMHMSTLKRRPTVSVKLCLTDTTDLFVGSAGGETSQWICLQHLDASTWMCFSSTNHSACQPLTHTEWCLLFLGHPLLQKSAQLVKIIVEMAVNYSFVITVRHLDIFK